MSVQHTIEYVSQFFKDNGCKLLEKKYLNNKQQLAYLCKCGKMGISSFKSFANKKCCKLCCLKKKYEPLKDALNNKKIFESENLFSMMDAAEILNIPTGRFYDMVRVLKILPAPKRTSIFSATKRREYYSEADIENLKVVFEELLAKN